jgi:hypothetical protein
MEKRKSNRTTKEMTTINSGGAPELSKMPF